MLKEEIKFERTVVINNDELKEYLIQVEDIVNAGRENAKKIEKLVEKDKKYQHKLQRVKDKLSPISHEEKDKIEVGDWEEFTGVRLNENREPVAIFTDVVELRKYQFITDREKQLSGEETK